MEILTFSLDTELTELKIKPVKLTIIEDIPEILLISEDRNNQNIYYRHIINMYGQCTYIYVHEDLDNIAGLDRILKYFEDQFRKLWGYVL